MKKRVIRLFSLTYTLKKNGIGGLVHTCQESGDEMNNGSRMHMVLEASFTRF